MWDEIKNRFSELFTLSPTFLIILVSSLISLGVMPQTVRAGPCECKDIDSMAKRIEVVSTAEEAWKEIFAWSRGLRSSVPPPKTNDELDAKYVQLAQAPPATWDRIMREPVQAGQAPKKIGGLNEKGEPILNDAFRLANCDEIVEAVRVHERVHKDFFYGYSPDHVLAVLMESRHLRLRAESEVVSYREEKSYLLSEKQKLETRCKGFRVDQPYGVGQLSGSICSLSHVFQLQFIATPGDMHGVFSFTPGENGGTWSYSGTAVHGIVKNTGNGQYIVETKEGAPPVIQMDAGIVTHTNPMASSSQPGKPATLQLHPVANACSQRSPDGAQLNPK